MRMPIVIALQKTSVFWWYKYLELYAVYFFTSYRYATQLKSRVVARLFVPTGFEAPKVSPDLYLFLHKYVYVKPFVRLYTAFLDEQFGAHAEAGSQFLNDSGLNVFLSISFLP